VTATMNSILWLNIGLAVPFLLAFIGVPLWLTLRGPGVPRQVASRSGHEAAPPAGSQIRNVVPPL
jgi:hypothetical protein